MYKTDSFLVGKCRSLRKKGFTLGEIIKIVKLPKTTVYDHIYDIFLPLEMKERIKRKVIERITKFSREMKKIFNLKPHEWFNEETGVYRVSYHYVELANYIWMKAQKLRKNIKTASLLAKRIFLKAFFDDEGSIHFDKKLVRGFQYNLEILKLIQKLLKDFNIESKIDEKYKEIVISRKLNLIKFRDKINFSKGVYINPNRKNSIWKKKLEKREILDYTINSYKK